MRAVHLRAGLFGLQCFLCGLLAAAAAAEDPASLTGFYEGKLGNKLGVELSLRAENGQVTGSYFYSHVGTDIPLQGTMQPDGALVLEEQGKPGEVTGRWTGKLDASGTIQGTWTNAAGARPTRFTVSRRKPPAWERVPGEGNAVRVFAPGEAENQEVVHDGIGFRKTVLPKSKVRFPRLTRAPQQAMVAKVNQRIDELEEGWGVQACGEVPEDEEPPPGPPSSYVMKSSVHYASRNIYSVYATVERYCQGAPYPTNDENLSMTWDLETGQEVRFEDLFQDYEANKREILGILFAAQIEQALRPAVTPKDEDQIECAEEFHPEQLMQSSFTFSFSKAGLEVQPSWAHAVEACAELVTVPYEALRKVARPGSILARVLEP